MRPVGLHLAQRIPAHQLPVGHVAAGERRRRMTQLGVVPEAGRLAAEPDLGDGASGRVVLVVPFQDGVRGAGETVYPVQQPALGVPVVTPVVPDMVAHLHRLQPARRIEVLRLHGCHRGLVTGGRQCEAVGRVVELHPLRVGAVPLAVDPVQRVVRVVDVLVATVGPPTQVAVPAVLVPVPGADRILPAREPP